MNFIKNFAIMYSCIVGVSKILCDKHFTAEYHTRPSDNIDAHVHVHGK